jgi:hypothetical protein
MQVDRKGVISLVEPPISPSQRDPEVFDIHRNGSTYTQPWKTVVKPEHLRKELDLLCEGELPGHKPGKVVLLVITAIDVKELVAKTQGSSRRYMPEDVLCELGLEVVCLEIDAAAGQEEGNIDGLGLLISTGFVHP